MAQSHPHGYGVLHQHPKRHIRIKVFGQSEQELEQLRLALFPTSFLPDHSKQYYVEENYSYYYDWIVFYNNNHIPTKRANTTNPNITELKDILHNLPYYKFYLVPLTDSTTSCT